MEYTRSTPWLQWCWDRLSNINWSGIIGWFLNNRLVGTGNRTTKHVVHQKLVYIQVEPDGTRRELIIEREEGEEEDNNHP